jgi:hypothetical protein
LLKEIFFMDIHPQYTFDKEGKPVGVFIPIEEWAELAEELKLELPQWQKDALDIELKNIETNPDYLLKWEDVRKKFVA